MINNNSPVVIKIKSPLYLTTRQIADQQGRSERFARNLMKEMICLIGKRYEPEDILRDSKMINLYAWYDYQKYRKDLKAGLRVPDFDREKWAEECLAVERYVIE